MDRATSIPEKFSLMLVTRYLLTGERRAWLGPQNGEPLQLHKPAVVIDIAPSLGNDGVEWMLNTFSRPSVSQAARDEVAAYQRGAVALLAADGPGTVRYALGAVAAWQRHPTQRIGYQRRAWIAEKWAGVEMIDDGPLNESGYVFITWEGTVTWCGEPHCPDWVGADMMRHATALGDAFRRYDAEQPA